ncbi:carboxypeptidase regulatory-like domain-containing protein [Candidatus Uhrbacteria bacterium]|nr:carboxypeptidase regulatory-like domain-containing protein [Candidatus Uhrbacteria bacterium]
MLFLNRSLWKSVTVAVFVTALVAAVPSGRAATVTSANDVPTSLEAGANANHAVVFTTGTGAVEGSTIRLTFAPGFDLSNIVEDDADISANGIARTTAPTCAGAEQLSVAVAGNTVTFTVCAGDGGAITAGSEVTIDIGTQATDSGIGTNQIVNPENAGTYFVSIAGTFGDSGSIALPITSDGAVAVSAEVDQTSGGGGGGASGGTGCGDTTAPALTDILVSEVTTSSANVSWQTSEEADSAVDYGLTEAYETGSETHSSLVFAHSITLRGLAEGATYHFRVRSADTCGNRGASGDQTFTTLDASAPILSNIQVTDIAETSARVTWTTNEVATSLVRYGVTTDYGGTASDDTRVLEHSMILTGLTRNTTYHIETRSSDAAGNTGVSSDVAFTTLQNPPPANVSNLRLTASNAQNALAWSNPPDEDLAGIRVLVCPTTFPTSPTDTTCTKLTDTLAESYTQQGLTNGTTYFYGVFAYDRIGQFASGALISGTPAASTPAESELISSTETLPAETEPIPTSGEGEPTGEGTSTTEPAPDGQTEPTGEETEPPTNGQTEPITPPAETETPVSYELVLRTGGGAIELEASEERVVDVLADAPLSVEFFLPESTTVPERILLILGPDTYLLTPEDGVYRSDIRVSNIVARIPLTLIVSYSDGTSQTVSLTANVLPPGQVSEATQEGQRPLVGARVTLFSLETGEPVVWDASPYGELNPLTTTGTGTFGWYVPNGRYLVRAEKDGYVSAERVVEVKNHLAYTNLVLQPLEIPLAEPRDGGGEETSAAEFLATATERAVDALTTFQSLRRTPEAQTAAEVTTPAVAAAAVASTVVLAAAFDLVPFLQYFFGTPILFFRRRKRQGFGVVYDAIRKTPVDLAIIRLYRVSDNRLVASRVTDKGGRYFFLVAPGEYRITVTKPRYGFPSSYLSGVKDDGVYLDVYHGETIRVTAKDAMITPNIPLEPSDAGQAQTPAHVKRMRRLRRLQQTLGVGGVLLAAGVVMVRPSTLTATLAGVQVAVYLLSRRLALPRKPKNWGIVYDQRTGKPLVNALVRVFEPKYNKLLETSVTDARGRYTFLLGPNQYYSVYQKTGYETVEIRPIDYTKHKEAVEFSMPVRLRPTSNP